MWRELARPAFKDRCSLHSAERSCASGCTFAVEIVVVVVVASVVPRDSAVREKSPPYPMCVYVCVCV